MGLEDPRRFAVNEMEYVQRVAFETRRRPAWVEEIDDTASRLPSAVLDRRLPAVAQVAAMGSIALRANWRIGFRGVSEIYRRQYR